MIYTSTVLLSNLEPPGTSLRALRASRVAIVLPRKQNRHCEPRAPAAAHKTRTASIPLYHVAPSTRRSSLSFSHMLNVPTLPPGLSVSRHGTWIASPVTLPTGVAVWRRQRASIRRGRKAAAAEPEGHAGAERGDDQWQDGERLQGHCRPSVCVCQYVCSSRFHRLVRLHILSYVIVSVLTTVLNNTAQTSGQNCS